MISTTMAPTNEPRLAKPQGEASFQVVRIVRRFETTVHSPLSFFARLANRNPTVLVALVVAEVVEIPPCVHRATKAAALLRHDVKSSSQKCTAGITWVITNEITCEITGEITGEITSEITGEITQKCCENR